jgi:hypothetical protein
LKKKEKNGCSSENDKLMAATVKDRKNTHGHGSFPDVQSAKPNFFCVCVEMDENEQFSSKLTD